jgi:Ca2+-binding EF-hand superfamily protein
MALWLPTAPQARTALMPRDLAAARQAWGDVASSSRFLASVAGPAPDAAGRMSQSAAAGVAWDIAPGGGRGGGLETNAGGRQPYPPSTVDQTDTSHGRRLEDVRAGSRQLAAASNAAQILAGPSRPFGDDNVHRGRSTADGPPFIYPSALDTAAGIDRIVEPLGRSAAVLVDNRPFVYPSALDSSHPARDTRFDSRFTALQHPSSQPTREVPQVPPLSHQPALSSRDVPTLATRDMPLSSWPVDLSTRQSPFWVAVSRLETALMDEVTRIATSPPSPTSGSSFVLRHAFAYFDRTGSGAVTLDDLHSTLAEMRLVAPPPAPRAGRQGQGLQLDRSREWDGDASSMSGSVANSTGWPSHQRGGVDRQARSVAAAAWIGAATAEDRESIGGEDYADDRYSELGLDASQAVFARKTVVAVFRRMHGERDVGNSTSGRGIHEDQLARLDEAIFSAAMDPLVYADWARWAAPLNTLLSNVCDKVKASFLSKATAGGGKKDFARAFARFDTNHDGSLSIQEFKAALGGLVRTLRPDELQAVCDFFDADGDGRVSFREFVSLIDPSGVHASEDDEDYDNSELAYAEQQQLQLQGPRRKR